ncbi:Slp family lipoprotein [Escherichia coli]
MDSEPDRRWENLLAAQLCRCERFLDPVDFRGQLVTVVGPITGAVDGKIGNTPYKFMVMQVTGYKRWHLTQQVIMPPQPIRSMVLWRSWLALWLRRMGWDNPAPARDKEL